LRRELRDIASAHGMELKEECRIFVERMAKGALWIDSQLAMTEAVIDARTELWKRQSAPRLGNQNAALLKV
jgi:hypothetical protein